MARNAASILPTTTPTDKRILVENLQDPNPFSPPFKAQPSYQESKSFNGPPPPYTDLQAPNPVISNVPIGWDTPFSPQSSSVTNGGSMSSNVNPVSSNPYNPFQ